MEFEIKNAQGDILRFFASPGQTLRYEVTPARISQTPTSGSLPSDELAPTPVDGPPIVVGERER